MICATVPKASADGQEAHHLPVGVRRLRPHELERVRGHEAVVVLAVELVEPAPQGLAPHGTGYRVAAIGRGATTMRP